MPNFKTFAEVNEEDESSLKLTNDTFLQAPSKPAMQSTKNAKKNFFAIQEGLKKFALKQGDDHISEVSHS